MIDRWQVLEGDCIQVMASMEPQSVHCCVTSPPYWGLRDYGMDGQIGLETAPADYVAKMVEVFRAVRRVLRDEGTLWLVLGDSYAGGDAGSRDPDRWPKQSRNDHMPVHVKGNSGLKKKDLCMIPARVAMALQADGWYLRSDIIWAKPSPMPESVTDRPTQSHEHIFLLSKNAKYFYDAEAIKEPVSGTAKSRGTGVNPKALGAGYKTKQNASFSAAVAQLVSHRNKRDVWTVASQPFTGAHFAVFPPRLIIPCIDAGCPVGGTVLDPFSGSGTTGLVATDRGRNYIGIDLNPQDVKASRSRLYEANRQQKLFSGSKP